MDRANDCAPHRPGYEAHDDTITEKQPSASSAPSRARLAAPKVEPPAELQRLAAWLVWRYEPGDKKPRKVPYHATTRARRAGLQGNNADRANLVPFKEAHATAAKYKFEGVGLAILPAFRVVALDFDNCVDAGVVDDRVATLVATTYAELSPSGRGVRAFFRGALASRKFFTWQGYDFDIEFFGSSGFVTFTGDVLDSCAVLGNQNTVADLTPEVLALYEQRREPSASPAALAGKASADPLDTYEPRLELSLEQMRAALAKLDPDMPEPDWVKVGWAIHHETSGSDEGRALWHEWSCGQLSASGAASKYDERAANEKWSHAGRQSGRPVTFRSVLKMAKEADAASARSEKRKRFAEFGIGEFLHRPKPTWHVKGLLPKAALLMIYGESGSGKSFIALDLACAIARGETWRDFSVRKGRVIYLCAEGAGGFRNRVEAYCRHYGKAAEDLANLTVIPEAPNLLMLDDALALAESVKDRGPADLLIVDTLAQVSPGANENSGEDMGKVLSHCKALHEATGASVLLVHHAGKDLARGARGWSGLKAACDAELEINRQGEARWLRVSKMKDGEDGAVLGFRLEKVTFDSAGESVTSCVVREADVARPKKAGGKLQRAIREILEVDLADGMPFTDLVQAVLDRDPPAQDKADNARTAARRALRKMIEGGELAEKSGLVTFAA